MPEITTAVEESDDFNNRKIRNDDAREHARGQLHSKEVLTRTCRRVDELGTINEKDLIHCKNILQSNDYYKNNAILMLQTSALAPWKRRNNLVLR